MTGGNASVTQSVSKIAKSLNEKQSFVICLPTQATLDAVASGLALYYALKKAGKTVSIASAQAPDPQFGLVGQDIIQQTISSGGNTLVVSIPFSDGGVDDVTYNVDGGKLNILITPEAGQSKVNQKDVRYSYTGGKADAVITIYTPTLTALGALYDNHKEQFEGTEVINIDRHFTNTNYGTINYVDKKSPSMAQMINDIMRAMKAEVDKDIAMNLYDGLASATQNFTSHTVNAQTFRMAAFLLEKGATRKPQKNRAAGSAQPHAGGAHVPPTQPQAPAQKGSASGAPAPASQGQGSPSQDSQGAPQAQKGQQGEGAAQAPSPVQAAPSPLQPTAAPSPVAHNRAPSPLNQHVSDVTEPEPSPVERVRDEAGDKQTPGTAEAKESSSSTRSGGPGQQNKPGGKAQLKPHIFQGGGLNKG